MLAMIMCMAGWFGASARTVSDDEIQVVKRYGMGQSAPTEDPALVRLRQVTDSLINSSMLSEITVVGYSSPDGPQELNRRLAAKRADRICKYMVDELKVASSLIQTSSVHEDWAGFRDAVDRDVAFSFRPQVLALIDGPEGRDECEVSLKQLSGGKAWQYMARNILPPLRRTVVTFRFPSRDVSVVIRDDVPAEVTEKTTDNGPFIGVQETDTSLGDVKTDENANSRVVNEAPVVETVAETVVEVAQDEPGERGLNWYVKTNVPAWAMLWMNVAGEFDLKDHWSAQLPVYYSGFNYFTGNRKYRTLTFMPEVRWWPRADNQGFFAGAHVGIGFYNVAFGGAKRYQDHKERTPALGGGLDVGYRLPMSRNGRWYLEFSVGAGIYHLDYDVYNNGINGLLIERRKRTFYGVDNAAITVAYRFDLTRGGKKR